MLAIFQGLQYALNRYTNDKLVKVEKFIDCSRDS